MKSPPRIYVVQYSNGLLKSGTINELYAWIKEETGTELSKLIIGNRLRKIVSKRHVGPIDISRLLLPTGLTKSDIGGIGGSKIKARYSKFFIPELNRRMGANELWREKVQAKGKESPVSRTILRRLKAGISKLEILLSDDIVRLDKFPRKKQRKSTTCITHKKETVNSIVSKEPPTLWQTNKVKVIDEDEYRVKGPLPPMEDWKGWDNKYYRRNGL